VSIERLLSDVVRRRFVVVSIERLLSDVVRRRFVVEVTSYGGVTN